MLLFDDRYANTGARRTVSVRLRLFAMPDKTYSSQLKPWLIKRSTARIIGKDFTLDFMPSRELSYTFLFPNGADLDAMGLPDAYPDAVVRDVALRSFLNGIDYKIQVTGTYGQRKVAIDQSLFFVKEPAGAREIIARIRKESDHYKRTGKCPFGLPAGAFM